MKNRTWIVIVIGTFLSLIFFSTGYGNDQLEPLEFVKIGTPLTILEEKYSNLQYIFVKKNKDGSIKRCALMIPINDHTLWDNVMILINDSKIESYVYSYSSWVRKAKQNKEHTINNDDGMNEQQLFDNRVPHLLRQVYKRYGFGYQFKVKKESYKNGESDSPLLLWKKDGLYYAMSYTPKEDANKDRGLIYELRVFKNEESVNKLNKIINDPKKIIEMKVQYNSFSRKIEDEVINELKSKKP